MAEARSCGVPRDHVKGSSRPPAHVRAWSVLVSLALAATGQTTLGTPPAAAEATSLYVDQTVAECSDSGAGTASAPYCSLNQGVARLHAGDTLYVGDGVYRETIRPAVSGTASAPVTITRWAGRSPTIGVGMADGVVLSGRSYVTVSGLAIANTTSDGIYVSGSNNVTISGNTVTGAGRPASGQTAVGISVRGSSKSQVSGNTTDHNNGHGILLTSGSTDITVDHNKASWNAEGWRRNANGIDVISPGNTVLGNITHDNEDSGINFYTGGDDNAAILNVSYNNGDHGIDNLNVTGGRLIGNTIYRNCTTGINVEGTSGNYVVANNIAVDNAVYPTYNDIACSRRAGNIGIWDSAPATTQVDHNLVWLTKPGKMYVFKTSYTSLSAMQSATGQEADGVQADPALVDAAHGNLRLSPGSAAIDRADSGVPGAQDTDIDGNPRVRDPSVSNAHASGPRLYDDIGAYEFQPGAAPPPAAEPPIARLSVTPSSGTAPLQVSADASASSDPQGQGLSYAFDFGDGSSAGPQAGASATHTFTTAGTYQVEVTVRNDAGLTGSAIRTVTAGVADPQPPAEPPIARLSVTPSSGTAPLQVSADASASSDPQGQGLSYAFDFGDGTGAGPQAGASATHTFTTAGTYQVEVTVRNDAGLTDSATATVTVTTETPQTAPGYVNQIATNYSTGSKTSGSITVWRAGGVQAGDLVVLTLQLGSTAAAGPVSGSDTAGNSYASVSSVADSSGQRLVVLVGVARTALAVNAKITVVFPTSTGYRLVGDEFEGVTTVDSVNTGSGAAGAFGSGAVTSGSPREVVFGAVSVAQGTANPTWAPGWKDLGSYAVGSSYLGRADQLPTGTGSFTASGTAAGPWVATVLALRP